MRLLLLFTFILQLVALTLCSKLYGASYGEPCKSKYGCDSRFHLTCIDKTCQCLNETEMVYDTAQGRCVVPLGKRCMLLKRRPNTDLDFEDLPCPEYAWCLGNCVCERGYHDNHTGKCIKSEGYGKRCENNAECPQMEENLICVGGKCSCNETEAIYDGSECVGKVGVGTSTEKYRNCVSNADGGYCESIDESCCKCHKDYTAVDGLCYAEYNISCHSGSKCLDRFFCHDGKCACHFPNYQEYRHFGCVSKLNGPCLEPFGGKVVHYQCHDEAECRDDNGIHECLCRKGYIQAGDNVCKKTFGSTCFWNHDCHVTPEAQLLCKNKTCSCDDFQIYDHHSDSAKCFGLVGAKCSKKLECFRNSFCKRPGFNSSSETGICRCNHGAEVVTDTRECAYGRTGCKETFLPGTGGDETGTQDET